MPARAKYVYVVGDVLFVPAAATPSGLWVRTHVSVVKAACSYCDAKLGELCRNKIGEPITSTHFPRRGAARGKPITAPNVIVGSDAG